MSLHTKHHQVNNQLKLLDRSEFPLILPRVDLALMKLNEKVIECRLTFSINLELYQRIDSGALFNLREEVRTPFSTGEFLPDHDIQIEATLKPDLLPKLLEHAADANAAATYILNLSEQQLDSPLLFNENWLALSVTQTQESGETGYRTFWSYVSPSVFTQASTPNEQINDAIANFFQEWTEANLATVTQKATAEFLEGMTSLFQELADEIPKEFTQKLGVDRASNSIRGGIFQEVANFFLADEWQIYQLPGEPILQMTFQGKNGKWTCYAKAREQQQQFVFYSLCPINAPENKRLTVAEFITRANSGMIIGNFELDFTDGEIRYKTSIDIEGDFLSFELIKQLVYANVTMMDTYLSGIISVINSDVSPEKAIASIES